MQIFMQCLKEGAPPSLYRKLGEETLCNHDNLFHGTWKIQEEPATKKLNSSKQPVGLLTDGYPGFSLGRLHMGGQVQGSKR